MTIDREWLRTRARVVRPALRTVALKPRVPSRGAALLSWMTEAFLLADGRLPASHANLWECRQVARTFLDLGFDVDVINFRNTLWRPRRRYDVFIDNRLNMQRLAPQLNDDCIKIMHIETSHMLFQNAAEYRRLLELQRRRGVTLQPRRVERRLNLCIEHADCAIHYGSSRSAATFAYAGTDLHPVPGTPVREFPSPAGKDFDRIRRNFLWIGSNGLVLKGLDLVLEAFADMPDYHLTVCGPVDRETDFAAAFERELYQTPNITTRGWVDVGGPEFERLLQDTVGLVYPSASEAQSGTVVTALHAGLIPIVTPECDVDVSDAFGRTLDDPSIETIRATVQAVAALPADDLAVMATTGWEFARSHHTRARFAAAYRRIIEQLLVER